MAGEAKNCSFSRTRNNEIAIQSWLNLRPKTRNAIWKRAKPRKCLCTHTQPSLLTMNFHLREFAAAFRQIGWEKKQKIDNNSRGLGLRRKISCLVSALRRASWHGERRRTQWASGITSGHSTVIMLQHLFLLSTRGVNSDVYIRNISFFRARVSICFCCRARVFHCFPFIHPSKAENCLCLCAIWYRKVLLNGFRFDERGFGVHRWRHREAIRVPKADFVGFSEFSSSFKLVSEAKITSDSGNPSKSP